MSARPDLHEAAEAERADLADLLETLRDDQWTAPSLCAGWSVRDVAVHVVSYDGLSPVATAAAFVRGRFSVDRINQQVLARHRGLAPDEVVDLVRRHRRPRGLPAAMRGAIALTDGTIHHQDVRRALGLPREVPHERVRAALAVAVTAPTLPSRRLTRGLRLEADDLDWSRGTGPLVRGPGEALLMAVAGRAVALGDLGGPGVAVLRERIG